MDFLNLMKMNLDDISTDINTENVQLYVRRYLEPVPYQELVDHFCTPLEGGRMQANTSLNLALTMSIYDGKILHYQDHFVASTHAKDMQLFVDQHPFDKSAPRDDKKTINVSTAVTEKKNSANAKK